MGFAAGLNAGSNLGLGVQRQRREAANSRLNREILQLEAEAQFGQPNLAADSFQQQSVGAADLGAIPAVQAPPVENPLTDVPGFRQPTDVAQEQELQGLFGNLPATPGPPAGAVGPGAGDPGLPPTGVQADTVAILEQLQGQAAAEAGPPPLSPGEATPPALPDVRIPPVPTGAQLGAPGTVDQAARKAARKAPKKERAQAAESADASATSLGEAVAELPEGFDADLAEAGTEQLGAAAFGFMGEFRNKLLDNYRRAPRTTDEFVINTFGFTPAQAERFREGNFLDPENDDDEKMLADMAVKMRTVGAGLKAGQRLTLPKSKFGTKSFIAQRELALQNARDNISLSGMKARMASARGSRDPREDEVLLRLNEQIKAYSGLPEILAKDYVAYLSNNLLIRQVALQKMEENKAAGQPAALTTGKGGQVEEIFQAYRELEIPKRLRDPKNKKKGRKLYLQYFDSLVKPPAERSK